jgi:hypothetical protein
MINGSYGSLMHAGHNAHGIAGPTLRRLQGRRSQDKRSPSCSDQCQSKKADSRPYLLGHLTALAHFMQGIKNSTGLLSHRNTRNHQRKHHLKNSIHNFHRSKIANGNFYPCAFSLFFF